MNLWQDYACVISVWICQVKCPCTFNTMPVFSVGGKVNVNLVIGFFKLTTKINSFHSDYDDSDINTLISLVGKFT